MEMQKELIRELGQRGGKEFDYLFILKSLNEIKFPVGKTLLVDFLIGNLKNPSIKKNDLFEKYNFGKLRYYTESEIRSMIDNLIANAMIELTNYSQNKFAQVLELNSKGSEELMNPKLYKKKITLENKKTNISEEEKLLFSELDYLLRGYNDEQKKAIISNKKNILCIAGAGSGKTSVLTKRIDFLVRYRSVNPSKILAITFTRKARSEMQHKLEKHGIIGVNIETFNSFSEKILKKYSPLIYSRPTRVMSYQDKIFLISFALNELNLSMQEAAGKYFSESQKKNKEEQRLINIFINDCFSVIEYFKSKNQKLYDFSKDASKEEYESAKMISKICMSIEKQMKILGLRDYIDQIIDTIEFFRKNENLIPEFDHVLIDEYQDVNAMQIELIDLIKKKNVFAVGDPRQSIFGWRGSDISYIMKFEERHKETEKIYLVKNYRSNKKIVEFMNNSIKDMKAPDLEATKHTESRIIINNFNSEEEEYEFVSKEILNLKQSTGLGEIFVLARTNRQLNELSTKLKTQGIAHILSTDEIKRPTIKSKDEVTLATIHAIKGLEAKAVFVIGCNEQNFPCKASDHPVIEIVKMGMQEYDKEQEEKRLFYVAISRAKEKLYITYTGKKMTYFINKEMIKMVEE